jgi:hypothetical protein
MATVVEQSKPVTSGYQLPVSSENVGEIIRHIEAKHDLLQYEVDGWCVWPTLRFPVAMALMDLPFTKSKEPFRLRELMIIPARDSLRLLFPRRSRYAVMTFSSGLMDQEGDRYRDVFFDDLLAELGSFFKIETLNNKAFLARSRSALFKSDVTTTAFELLSTLVIPRFRKPSEISSVSEKLSANLRSELGLESFSAERISAMLGVFYWKKKLYSWLLGRIRPQYLFSADGFSDHPVIAAAKERGIRVCEFQHGGFMKGGPEYGWSPYALRYKSKMPLPNQIFLFGHYWREQLEGGFWGEELITVGSMRMDRYRELKNKKLSGRTNRACNIVLTTQGIDTPKLIQFVSDFLRLVEGKREVNLTFKLHPVLESDKGIYEREFTDNKRVRVISGTEAPSTFELLVSADLHLSISSTSHYDALGLGVPTVILPLANSGWVLQLHRAGHAFLARSPEELFDIVQHWHGQRVPDAVGSYYFQPGAVANIRAALEGHIEVPGS